MASPTPPHTPTVHARGVFREEETFHGLVIFRIYNCVGDLVELSYVAEEWCDDEIEIELTASLDKRCPDSDHSHQDPPFPGRLPFRLM